MNPPAPGGRFASVGSGGSSLNLDPNLAIPARNSSGLFFSKSAYPVSRGHREGGRTGNNSAPRCLTVPFASESYQPEVLWPLSLKDGGLIHTTPAGTEHSVQGMREENEGAETFFNCACGRAMLPE